VRRPIWEAWRDLVEWLVDHPGGDVFLEAAMAGFGIEPKDWRESVAIAVEGSTPDGSDDGSGRRFRILMGEIMDELRGRVPAAQVAAELQALMTAAKHTTVI